MREGVKLRVKGGSQTMGERERVKLWLIEGVKLRVRGGSKTPGERREESYG